MNAAVLESTLGRWRSLAPRERRVLGAGALVLLVAIVYLLLFEPAWLGRERLRTELPQLREQVARMDALTAEARTLGQAPVSRLSQEALRAELQRALNVAGLGNGATVELTGDLLRVRMREVPFGGVLDWSQQVTRDLKLRIVDASIARDAQAGLVSASLSLQSPASETRR